MTANFTYDSAGDQSGSTYTDSTGGSVSDAVVSRDDAGRPLVMKETAGGGSTPSTTTTAADTYTAEGQLASDTAGPSGATTAYDYEQAADPAPGSVKDVKLLSGGATLSETDYGYDPATKQLQTITVKGQGGSPSQVFTLAYQPNTDLLTSVASPASTTSLTYDQRNQRLSSIGAGASGSTHDT